MVAGLVGVPVSTLLANEAVYAAKYQSRRAAEQLDVALRLGFWRNRRCVTGCDAVDVDQLADDLHSRRRAKTQRCHTASNRRQGGKRRVHCRSGVSGE